MKVISNKIFYSIIFILLLGTSFLFGYLFASYQCDINNPYLLHMDMAYEGYNYCPICGEPLSKLDY